MYRYTVHREDGFQIYVTTDMSTAVGMAERMEPQGYVMEEEWAVVTTQQVWPD